MAKLNSVLFTFFLIIFNLSVVSAEIFNSPTYSDDTGFTVESQNNTTVEVNYSIGDFTLTTIEIDGELFQNINLPAYFLPNDAGAPNLPGSGRYIAVPQEATVSIKIISYQSDTLKNVNIAPSFRIPKDNEKSQLEYVKNKSIYSSDKFFPEEPFMVSDKDIIRGIDVVMLGLTPFQYNPVKKQLIVYQDIKIEIRCKGGTNNFGNNKLRSRWWDPVLSDMLLNYESLPKMDYNKSFKAKDETGCEYLIITPNATEFQVWADSIKEFRTTQGIFTKVVTLSEIGSNTASSIEAYINNGYNTWDIVPAACLLLGDYGTDGSNRIISPLWENYCISDNIYADVDALIALSVNGELIGTGTGTGAPVSITIPGQTPPDPVLVTVTKQNYFRYDRYVEVLPATGPYVVYNEIEINDISGNGNGVMETSESILASITGKNIGVENAENIEVSLTTTDAYITITDGTEYYGSITAGNVAVVTDAFSWVCISLI